ncbi:zinc metalloproteinase nas-7 [Anabrus simplex]|uniref:zinc metalloproteinase nas-7 n=1 Tax=Anabrus simplex TaxID=316456 RepID=UPI0035A2C198
MGNLPVYLLFLSIVDLGLLMPIPDDTDLDLDNLIEYDVKYFSTRLAALGDKRFDDPNEETGDKVAQWNASSVVNPEELGEYAEGDILFPMARNGLAAESTRWPDGKVYYQISPSFSQKDVDLIQLAFKHYHEYTCIKFLPYTGKEQDYIYVTKENTGCWSSVGRTGGPQQLNLQSPGCTSTVGTPIHEFMHALGFLHEQNRWERDQYVSILWQNIQSGRDDNFKAADKSTTEDFGVPYDYYSVMHYSSHAFSINGRPTILAKDANAELGQRKGLSKGDIKKINSMYKCKKSAGIETSISDIVGNIISIFG